MHDTIFYYILNMSIIASLMGIVIMLLRKLTFIPRIGIYCLWIPVLLRLLIPFGVSSRISLMNLTGSLVKKVVEFQWVAGDSVKLSMSNVIGAAAAYNPVVFKTQQLKAVFGISAVVWLAGAAGFIAGVLILYCLSGRELRKAAHIREDIYSGEGPEAPMVYGFFRQRIILPRPYLEAGGLKYIILHERAHMARHDNLLRLAAVLTACIHWFNPFIWVFLKAFMDDMELTCDNRAVRGLSQEQRKQYASTLLSAGAGRKPLIPAAFGNNGVRARVVNVMTYRSLSILAFAITLVFVAAATAILITNPVK